MRRLLFTSAIAAAALSSARAEELRREVFPVPDVVEAAFRGGGLAAFDPFDPWLPGSARRKQLLAPSPAGEDGSRMPAGVCYDILPAWMARGFKPQEGTRVLYHPQSQMLYAKIAPGDEAQVRAFCEWPPAMWMNGTHLDRDGVKQILFRITTYEVPASGAGGWNFQPATVAEFLTLPEAARRILHRQSMIIRGGQRAKVDGLVTSPQDFRATLSGQTVEAECTIGDDDSTVDLNVAPAVVARLADGSVVTIQSSFQHLIEWGNSWLMEAGTLPGDPPRRIFQVYEVLRLHPEMRDPIFFHHCLERWTGRPGEGAPAPGAATGRTLSSFDFSSEWLAAPDKTEPGSLLPATRIPKAVDPFATPGPKAGTLINGIPETTVPELFGDVTVRNVTALLELKTGLAPGLIRAWEPPSGNVLYVQGTAEGIAALNRSLEDSSDSVSAHTGIAQASLQLISPGAPAPGKTVWQGSVPIRAGQRSSIKLMSGQDTDNETQPDPVYPCYFEIEASYDEVPGPTPNGASLINWTLAAGALFRPPFVDAPVQIEVQTETGTREGVTLTRTVGRSAAGEDIVLSIRLRDVAVHSRLWSPGAAGDWWWRRQVAKAAK